MKKLFPVFLFAGTKEERWSNARWEAAWRSFARHGRVYSQDTFDIGYEVSWEMNAEDALAWARG